ncbi:hypothetical protein Tgr7_0428 [Thioalkalivibrio sulfidiphilus HL-EbGr7]|uniref:Lipoprotein n=1 Tax=Thioalkalivibrio sulfidiphilus (strain HL-EbGR7) TaxID=396588 RepID=B8GL08_THISH|nr:hypothetical protein [Thioalkalivibrio sulfidiphilus]ACL71526.1 hypothetical protein Tgr7_0428 [Thioalkalivibrio sulfidiphilus HL-EbGr7]
MRHLARLCLTVFVALSISLTAGCAALRAVQDHPLAARLAVEQTTLRWIGDDLHRAERTREVIAEVRPHIEGSATVATLDQAARSAIRWDSLSLADQRLLETLLDELKQELERRIGAGLLDPDQQMTVAAVLDWIDAAAQDAQRFLEQRALLVGSGTIPATYPATAR